MSEIEERFDENAEQPASDAEPTEAGQEEAQAAAAAEPENDEAASQDAAEEDAPAAKDDPSSIDDALYDKANKAARLLRARRAALRAEADERGGQPSLLVRAIKLLDLKPKMQQKEMADLLGCRLRELDAVLAEAEEQDIVARIEPDEPDMRKVVVMAADDAMDLALAAEKKEDRLVPGLSDEDASTLNDLLDKVIDPLVALGLDTDREEKRPFRGGHDDRGGRGHDDRRGGFGGNGGRGGYRGGNDRGGYRGHDDRGGRGHDDRRGGGFRGGDDRRSNGGYRGHDDRGSRGGFGGNGGRGGYRGGNDRGGYRGDSDRGGYHGHDDRGPRGGYRGGRYDR